MAPQIVRLLQRDAARWNVGRTSQVRRGAGPKRPGLRTDACSLVVEFGCGSGVVARHLVDAGFDVLGIDASPAMIDLARRNVPEARFTIGTLSSARIPRCRAIVAIGEVVSYVLEGHNGLSTFFARAARALEPGGLLLFDFIESAEGRTYPSKSRSGADWALVFRATADRRGRFLTRRIITFRKIGSAYRRGEETHKVRIFTRAEMAAALERAGFEVRMRRSLGGVKLIRGDVLACSFTKSPSSRMPPLRRTIW
jgi:SAM-dependent methyltransferase